MQCGRCRMRRSLEFWKTLRLGTDHTPLPIVATGTRFDDRICGMRGCYPTLKYSLLYLSIFFEIVQRTILGDGDRRIFYLRYSQDIHGIRTVMRGHTSSIPTKMNLTSISTSSTSSIGVAFPLVMVWITSQSNTTNTTAAEIQWKLTKKVHHIGHTISEPKKSVAKRWRRQHHSKSCKDVTNHHPSLRSRRRRRDHRMERD